MTRDEEIDAVCLEWGASIDAFRAGQTKENRERVEAAHTRLRALIKDAFGPIPINLYRDVEYIIANYYEPPTTPRR